MGTRFNPYDFVAHLILGIVFTIGIETFFGKNTSFLSLNIDITISRAIFLVIISYVAGLLLQSLGHYIIEKHVPKRLWGGRPSERWLRRDDKYFSDAYKDYLFGKIDKVFNLGEKISSMNQQELFYLCYHYVGAQHPRLLVLNAQYGLFRGLIVVFGFLFLFSLIRIGYSFLTGQNTNMNFIIYSAITGLLMILACKGYKKRGEDFVSSVIYLFVVKAAIQLSEKKSNDDIPPDDLPFGDALFKS